MFSMETIKNWEKHSFVLYYHISNTRFKKKIEYAKSSLGIFRFTITEELI